MNTLEYMTKWYIETYYSLRENNNIEMSVDLLQIAFNKQFPLVTDSYLELIRLNTSAININMLGAGFNRPKH